MPAQVELDEGSLVLAMADGRWRRVQLGGSRVWIGDAAHAQRFVRHAAVSVGEERFDLITPPEDGAIAPRAAQLPGVPDDTAIVPGWVWETVTCWIAVGGRLGGFTIAELAQLARLASSQFAIALGECAAHVAAEMTWERLGPMRGGVDLHHLLRPLEEAARHSARAGEALVAALSLGSVLRPVAFAGVGG
jgi:hypothetical protein